MSVENLGIALVWPMTTFGDVPVQSGPTHAVAFGGVAFGPHMC